MAYVKKYATDAERSKAKSEAAKRGVANRKALGYANVGRKKGSLNKNPRTSLPVKSLTVREPDYQIFSKLAFAQQVSLVEMMHLIAESIKAKNPQVFEKQQELQL